MKSCEASVMSKACLLADFYRRVCVFVHGNIASYIGATNALSPREGGAKNRVRQFFVLQKMI